MIYSVDFSGHTEIYSSRSFRACRSLNDLHDLLLTAVERMVAGVGICIARLLRATTAVVVDSMVEVCII